MIDFFKSVFQLFGSSNTSEKGAALAYYAVFSMLPMIVIVVSILGLVFGADAVSGDIYAQLQGILGDDGAHQIEDIVKQQHINHSSTLTTILGFATLALSASGMLSQLHSSFDAIWEVSAPSTNGLINYVRKHFVSFSILITLFFILLLSTSIHSFLVHHSDRIPAGGQSLYWIEHLVSFLLTSVVFALMFRFLGDAEVQWRPALVGGLFTAILFLVGKVGIGMYIGHSKVSTTFGSASALALIMMWVYYTSQIIFLGTAFVRRYQERYGSIKKSM